MTELVVLVSEDGTPIGTEDKVAVHTENTALHLAFSCHVFNESGKILVTRRALSKQTWPGVWTNSFCGHPAPGETFDTALARRAQDELGITITDIEEVLPNFSYRAVDASGIVENELCPVFIARTSVEPSPNPAEVEEYVWAEASAFLTAVTQAPFAFSPWLVLQLPLLDQSGVLPS